jgi:hypothetical protein
MLDLVRIRLEERENHHAGDRNVEPDGERQACDSAVHRESTRQREKNVVSTIGRATMERITWLAKMERYSVRTGPRPGKNRVAVQCMVHDVADEKNGREREG